MPKQTKKSTTFAEISGPLTEADLRLAMTLGYDASRLKKLNDSTAIYEMAQGDLDYLQRFLSEARSR